MITNELKHSIDLFDIRRQKDALHFIELENIQIKFVKDFPIKVIEKLEIDDYIIGKNSHSSFCYRIERQLDKIGTMRGATSNKFVVYYGKNGKDSNPKYRFTKKLGIVKNEDEALEKVKKEIIDLINAGKINDHKSINKNRLAPLFKYKILGTYYPTQYLNLYSQRHLDYFIRELGLNQVETKILNKQVTLLNFKNSIETMSKWSNHEFNSFLYTEIGTPPSNDEEAKKQDTLPSINKVKPEPIEFTIIDSSNKKSSKGKGSAKPNYKEQQEKNNQLGKQGESIVLKWEKAFIKTMKLPIDQLEHSSEKDDRLGYDIKSLDEKGKVKYIEVKATRRKQGDASFIITDNEKDKAEKLDNYYIYIVFETHTLHPKIWQIKEPFKVHQDKFQLTPINYRVEISVKD
jgi:hypothetical protein